MLAGFAIGKIKIYQISLHIAGILFISILVGFLIHHVVPPEYYELVSEAHVSMKTFSKLGASLFVAVIGIQTGLSIKNNSRSALISFVIGCVMSISGVITMVLLSLLDTTISYSTFLGILCGALTSTPGLSSVCELIQANSEEAVFGYGCSYLLGVILVVLLVQLITPKSSERATDTLTSQSTKESKMFSELMLVCFVALLGNILGSISVPPLHLSIGSTASTLLVGLIAGYVVQKNLSSVPLSSQVLSTLKNFGLAVFFVGTGYSTGIQSINFNVRTILYGAIITLSALICGLLMCKLVFARRQLHIGCIVAGGMTSSPAYGVLSHQIPPTSINSFSFAYFGSLISLVICIQIIGK